MKLCLYGLMNNPRGGLVYMSLVGVRAASMRNTPSEIPRHLDSQNVLDKKVENGRVFVSGKH